MPGASEALVDAAAAGERLLPFDFDDILELAMLAATGYLCFSYYPVVGRLASLRGFDLGPRLRTVFDHAIPFIPAFVIPYALAFVLPMGVAAEVAHTGGLPAFRRTFFTYLGLLAVHFAVFLILPNSAKGIMLPESVLTHGRLETWVRFFYGIAPPWNACPSFHVSGSWFFYRALERRVCPPAAARAYQAWFWTMFAAISAIKIHWFLDGVAGLLLAEAAYRFVLVPLEDAGACEWRWRSARLRLAAHAAPLAALGAGLWLASGR